MATSKPSSRRAFETGDERCALAEVVPVAHDVGALLEREHAGAILRPVVDDDDGAELGDRLAERAHDVDHGA